MRATVDDLNNYIEWNSPFEVTASGTIRDASHYTPDVLNDPHGDVTVSPGWEPLTGYTGQHGYRGAVMHMSEPLAGRLAEDVLSTPGVYVVTEVRDELGDYPDGDPIGWAILRRTV